MKFDYQLIYDLGLHRGEDTEYYLKRGFRVIAVEADEELVAQNLKAFQKYVESGQLVVIHGAISDIPDDTVIFYKNPQVSVWGTVVKSWAERNAKLGADSVEITVNVVSLKSLFKKYGVPYYLKIDIEGMDLVALKTLSQYPIKPKYVSIESEKAYWDQLIEEFNVLEELGYDAFNLVEQTGVPKQKIPADSIEGRIINHQFKRGSSGMFGSDLTSQWLSKEEALEKYKEIFKLYRIFGDNSVFTKIYLFRAVKAILQRIIQKPLPGWYDTHARLKD